MKPTNYDLIPFIHPVVMKYLFILIALIPLKSVADGFLEIEDGPEPIYLTPLDPLPHKYAQRVEEHLFVTGGDCGRVNVRHSSGAELCVSVYSMVPEEVAKNYEHEWFVPKDKRKYFITVTRASESLWLSMAENNDEKKTRKVAVSRIDREISIELAMAVQRAWARMLHLTRYPSKAGGGMDGTTYEFSVWVRGLGDLYGKTWSPQGGLTAELVSLGGELNSFAEAKEGDEKTLIERLKAFEAKVPKA